MQSPKGISQLYGEGYCGYLGIGKDRKTEYPIELIPIPYFKNINCKMVSACDDQTLVLDEYGKMYCFGSNYAMHSMFSKKFLETPKRIHKKERFCNICAGKDYNIAVTTKNKIVIWGLLTDGKLKYYTIPTKIDQISNDFYNKKISALDCNGNIWEYNDKIDNFELLPGDEKFKQIIGDMRLKTDGNLLNKTNCFSFNIKQIYFSESWGTQFIDQNNKLYEYDEPVMISEKIGTIIDCASWMGQYFLCNNLGDVYRFIKKYEKVSYVGKSGIFQKCSHVKNAQVSHK